MHESQHNQHSTSVFHGDIEAAELLYFDLWIENRKFAASKTNLLKFSLHD